eukprot:scaffold2236_cov136-Isochrysis_galbana.AAC.6
MVYRVPACQRAEWSPNPRAPTKAQEPTGKPASPTGRGREPTLLVRFHEIPRGETVFYFWYNIASRSSDHTHITPADTPPELPRGFSCALQRGARHERHRGPRAQGVAAAASTRARCLPAGSCLVAQSAWLHR